MCWPAPSKYAERWRGMPDDSGIADRLLCWSVTGARAYVCCFCLLICVIEPDGPHDWFDLWGAELRRPRLQARRPRPICDAGGGHAAGAEPSGTLALVSRARRVRTPLTLASPSG